jgi:hypothetical protein
LKERHEDAPSFSVSSRSHRESAWFPWNLILFDFMLPQHSLVDIKNFTFSYDKKYVKELVVNHTVDSNGVSTFNGLVDNRYVITKLIGFLRVRIPEDQNDKEFKRDFMKVSVDVEKLLSGQANFIVKLIAKIVLESCDRKVEFPVAKVRSTTFSSIADFKTR